MGIKGSRSGFTIVELLIVIVVIAILAALSLVAFNGIRTRAEDASLQSETSQAAKKVLTYKSLNGEILPTDSTMADLSVGSGHDLYYRLTPDGKNFCVAVNITGSPERAYSATSTNAVAKKGTCQGYILVPGNSALGTSDFWVMKYEAKNVSGVAMSQASGAPWVSIIQSDAIAASQTTCEGCHLVSEAEWMTLAGNVLSVSSNWSGGVVGSGYIYSGHNDGSPGNALVASSTDTDGYNGTGQSGTSSQRRTLTLTNGEVVWDLSGNIWEWTTGTLSGGQLPGVIGQPIQWQNWNDSQLSWNGLPSISRPTSLTSAYDLSLITSWTIANGVGGLFSFHSDTLPRGFLRSGGWDAFPDVGVLTLHLGNVPSSTNEFIGFRVAR
ncbi:MAG: prepilin-type N-terminal cleavage/methylation domain-containing protein [Candidatus Microsaccharimonas sp.]